MSFSQTDYQKIIKGAFLAFSGATLTYVVANVIALGSMDWKIFIVAAVSVGLNAVVKFFSGPSE